MLDGAGARRTCGLRHFCDLSCVRHNARGADFGPPGCKQGHRAIFERVIQARLEPCRLSLRKGGVEKPVPKIPTLGLGQLEVDRLPVTVQKEKKGFADYRLAALVFVVDQIASQSKAQAPDKTGGVQVSASDISALVGVKNEISLTFDPRIALPRKNLRR